MNQNQKNLKHNQNFQDETFNEITWIKAKGPDIKIIQTFKVITLISNPNSKIPQKTNKVKTNFQNETMSKWYLSYLLLSSPQTTAWMCSLGGKKYEWNIPLKWIGSMNLRNSENSWSLSISLNLKIQDLNWCPFIIPPKLHWFILKISFQLEFGYSPCTRIPTKHPWLNG